MMSCSNSLETLLTGPDATIIPWEAIIKTTALGIAALRALRWPFRGIFEKTSYVYLQHLGNQKSTASNPSADTHRRSALKGP